MSYLELHNLNAHKLSCEYARKSWIIYEKLNWQLKKIIGDQMIRSVDSVRANIAESYGRYHYLDKNKFYYFVRGSLLESKHWIDRLYERKIIIQKEYLELIEVYRNLKPCLNG